MRLEDIVEVYHPPFSTHFASSNIYIIKMKGPIVCFILMALLHLCHPLYAQQTKLINKAGTTTERYTTARPTTERYTSHKPTTERYTTPQKTTERITPPDPNTTTQAPEVCSDDPYCVNTPVGFTAPYPSDCTKFVVCESGGTYVIVDCPSGQHYSPTELYCMDPAEAQCVPCVL